MALVISSFSQTLEQFFSHRKIFETKSFLCGLVSEQKKKPEHCGTCARFLLKQPAGPSNRKCCCSLFDWRRSFNDLARSSVKLFLAAVLWLTLGWKSFLKSTIMTSDNWNHEGARHWRKPLGRRSVTKGPIYRFYELVTTAPFDCLKSLG